MPDQFTTLTNESKNRVSGYRGSEAGKSFDTNAQLAEKEDWNAYKIANKLGFAENIEKHRNTPAFVAFRNARALARAAAGVEANREINAAARRFPRSEDMTSDQMIEEAARGYR